LARAVRRLVKAALAPLEPVTVGLEMGAVLLKPTVLANLCEVFEMI
jgi:hypothetical protein